LRIVKSQICKINVFNCDKEKYEFLYSTHKRSVIFSQIEMVDLKEKKRKKITYYLNFKHNNMSYMPS